MESFGGVMRARGVEYITIHGNNMIKSKEERIYY